MSEIDAEVLLITADARLREVVGRCRPAQVRLRCVTPTDLAAARTDGNLTVYGTAPRGGENPFLVQPRRPLVL